MIVYLFGVLPLEADTFLIGANTDACSWPACANGAVAGVLLKTPHSADNTGLALSCACAEHRPELEATTVANWSPLATATQTTV
ncbi:MAG: hypothetical protein KAI25_03955 [Hyphomicrobiaceae bacterium]|nr:hypothetical protein [Hyphomicrobiaceae bacterium]